MSLVWPPSFEVCLELFDRLDYYHGLFLKGELKQENGELTLSGAWEAKGVSQALSRLTVLPGSCLSAASGFLFTSMAYIKEELCRRWWKLPTYRFWCGPPWWTTGSRSGMGQSTALQIGTRKTAWLKQMAQSSAPSHKLWSSNWCAYLVHTTRRRNCVTVL